jgi:hypothetical protein
MSRALFIAKLREGLAGLPPLEIDEITSDYEHHFSEAIAIGQSEDDTVARLGDPARLARELREDREQRRSTEEGSPPPPVRTASGARVSGRLGLLLALLAVIGMAAAAYYVTSRDGGAPAPIARSAPSAPPAPPVSPQQAVAPPANGARIVISGGQVLDLGNIAQERIEILLDGSGRATARGRVKELTLHIDGSGSADFGALQADIVHVDVSGTGNAEVSGTQMVDVTILGSGTVRLKDKPKTLKQSVTGSGQVILPSRPPQP